MRVGSGRRAGMMFPCPAAGLAQSGVGDRPHASAGAGRCHGRARRPWITWFTDCATNAITGVAVTPGIPSRESVLAALRSAVLREDPYGPFGGLPEKVRVDRGKDFLSRTVTAAFDLLDVTVEDLPAYTPHLKGTVEGLNRAVEGMFLAALPGYARQPRPGRRASRPGDEVLLGFEDFTARLLDWTSWWNTEHRPAPLRGKTPLEAWQDDPTPLRDVPAADLWTFTLEDAGTRTLTTRGIRFRKCDYVGAVDDRPGRGPGPHPLHAPPRPPRRGLPRHHRPLPGFRGPGRPGHRGTGQRRAAGTGGPRRPSWGNSAPAAGRCTPRAPATHAASTGTGTSRDGCQPVPLTRLNPDHHVSAVRLSR